MEKGRVVVVIADVFVVSFVFRLFVCCFVFFGGRGCYWGAG